MSIGTVGVIGAGQMGAGVAQVAAQAGVKVLLNDISEDFVARGLESVGRNLDRMIQRGRFKPDERDRIMRRIETTAKVEDLKDTDFVIEAVVENEDAKIALFQKLDKVCPEHVIFASNTSSISITRMGARSTRADSTMLSQNSKSSGASTMIVDPCSNQPSSSPFTTLMSQGKVVGPMV